VDRPEEFMGDGMTTPHGNIPLINNNNTSVDKANNSVANEDNLDGTK